MAEVQGQGWAYEPTEEERTEHELMGLRVALQTLEGMKAAAEGNPEWNPAIEFLREEIEELELDKERDNSA